MRARLTQPHSAQAYLANLKLTSDQMVKWYASRHQIAPRLTRRERNVLLPLERLDCLRFNERDFAPCARGLGERADSEEVSVALKPCPGDGIHLEPLLHRGHRPGRNVDGTNCATKHFSLPTVRPCCSAIQGLGEAPICQDQIGKHPKVLPCQLAHPGCPL